MKTDLKLKKKCATKAVEEQVNINNHLEQVSINIYLGAAREHTEQLIQNNEVELQLSEYQKVREKGLDCIKEIA